MAKDLFRVSCRCLKRTSVILRREAHISGQRWSGASGAYTLVSSVEDTFFVDLVVKVKPAQDFPCCFAKQVHSSTPHWQIYCQNFWIKLKDTVYFQAARLCSRPPNTWTWLLKGHVRAASPGNRHLISPLKSFLLLVSGKQTFWLVLFSDAWDTIKDYRNK